MFKSCHIHDLVYNIMYIMYIGFECHLLKVKELFISILPLQTVCSTAVTCEFHLWGSIKT